MGKRILWIFIAFIGLFTIIYALISTGVIRLDTADSMQEELPEAIISVEDLEDGKFYVWHDNQYSLEHDLEGAVDPDVFKICPEGTVNWVKNKNANHTIWFSSDEDNDIPTLFPGDQLIYVSKTSTPGENDSILEDGNIKWERYADYGYSIGVANLSADKSGHYYIEYNSDHGYEGFINKKTNAKDVSDFKNFVGSRIYIDKVGNQDVRNGLVSAGGTITGLTKNADYLCKWYKGTYVSDFKLSANSHVFSILESFMTHNWEFVANDTNLSDIHSCITITIPNHFKSGYYYIAGTGLFRYVSMEDISIYNGSAYDPHVNWNDPIILYDEHGLVMYDPFQNIDERDRMGAGTSTSNGSTVVNPNYNEQIYHSDFKIITDPNINQPDVGAEGYEDFDDEIVRKSDEEYFEDYEYDEDLEGSTDNFDDLNGEVTAE
ncbi:MAG: hypothetical protein Q4E51_05355 [Lachnospiraceae bacterium]|nr:hypothetical protein [Lachnospiraceae bacterium]